MQIRKILIILCVAFLSCQEDKIVQKTTVLIKSESFANINKCLKSFKKDSLNVYYYRNYTIIENAEQNDSVILKKYELNSLRNQFKNWYDFDLSSVIFKKNDVYFYSFDGYVQKIILKSYLFDSISNFKNYKYFDTLNENEFSTEINSVYKVNDSIYFIIESK